MAGKEKNQDNFLVRCSKEQGKIIRGRAKQAGTSLNRYVVAAAAAERDVVVLDFDLEEIRELRYRHSLTARALARLETVLRNSEIGPTYLTDVGLVLEAQRHTLARLGAVLDRVELQLAPPSQVGDGGARASSDE
jgi:hypothetical protein